MKKISSTICLSSKSAVLPKDFDDRSIRWLGLDRYQKIIYGVHLSSRENSSCVDLLKLCLFSKKLVSFKQIILPNFDAWPWFVRCVSNFVDVSKNGEQIGILVENSKNKEPVAKLVFCSIQLETGSFQIYDISDPRENMAERQLRDINDVVNETKEYCSCTDSLFCLCFWLKCTNKNEWVVKLPREKDIGRYYWLTLDEESSRGTLVRLTENPPGGNVVYEHKLFLDDKLVIFTEESGIMANMSVFDFVEKQWKIVETSHDPSAPKASKRRAVTKIFSQNGVDLLALMSPQESCSRRYFFLKFNKQSNVWLPTNMDYEICSVKAWYDPYVFPTPNFLPVIDSESDRVLDSPKIHYSVLDNMLSLKDICFVKLFESYGDRLVSLTEEEILRDTIFSNLPTLLKGQYWGPEYTRSVANVEEPNA